MHSPGLDAASEAAEQRPDQMGAWRGGASGAGSGSGMSMHSPGLDAASEAAEQRPDQMGAWRGGASGAGSGQGVFLRPPGLDAASVPAETCPDQMGAWRGGASGAGQGPAASLHPPGLDAASAGADQRPDQMGAWRGGASGAGSGPGVSIHSPGFDAPSEAAEQRPDQMGAWRAGASVAGAVPNASDPASMTGGQVPDQSEAWRGGASVAGAVPTLHSPAFDTAEKAPNQMGAWRAVVSVAGAVPPLLAPTTAEHVTLEMGSWRAGASVAGAAPPLSYLTPTTAGQFPDQMGSRRAGESVAGAVPLLLAPTTAEHVTLDMGSWRAGASVAGAAPPLSYLNPTTAGKFPDHMGSRRAGESVAGAVPPLLASTTAELAPPEMGAWRSGASTAGALPPLPAPITVGQVTDQMGSWGAATSLAGATPTVPSPDPNSVELGSWRAGASLAGAIPPVPAPASNTVEHLPVELGAWRAGASLAGAIPTVPSPASYTVEHVPVELGAWRAGASLAGAIIPFPAPASNTVEHLPAEMGTWRAGASVAGASPVASQPTSLVENPAEMNSVRRLGARLAGAGTTLNPSSILAASTSASDQPAVRPQSSTQYEVVSEEPSSWRLGASEPGDQPKQLVKVSKTEPIAPLPRPSTAHLDAWREGASSAGAPTWHVEHLLPTTATSSPALDVDSPSQYDAAPNASALRFGASTPGGAPAPTGLSTDSSVRRGRRYVTQTPKGSSVGPSSPVGSLPPPHEALGSPTSSSDPTEHADPHVIAWRAGASNAVAVHLKTEPMKASTAGTAQVMSAAWRAGASTSGALHPRSEAVGHPPCPPAAQEGDASELLTSLGGDRSKIWPLDLRSILSHTPATPLDPPVVVDVPVFVAASVSPRQSKLTEGGSLPSKLTYGGSTPSQLTYGGSMPSQLTGGGYMPSKLTYGGSMQSQLTYGGPLPSRPTDGGSKSSKLSDDGRGSPIQHSESFPLGDSDTTMKLFSASSSSGSALSSRSNAGAQSAYRFEGPLSFGGAAIRGSKNSRSVHPHCKGSPQRDARTRDRDVLMPGSASFGGKLVTDDGSDVGEAASTHRRLQLTEGLLAWQTKSQTQPHDQPKAQTQTCQPETQPHTQTAGDDMASSRCASFGGTLVFDCMSTAVGTGSSAGTLPPNLLTAADTRQGSSYGGPVSFSSTTTITTHNIVAASNAALLSSGSTSSIGAETTLTAPAHVSIAPMSDADQMHGAALSFGGADTSNERAKPPAPADAAPGPDAVLAAIAADPKPDKLNFSVLLQAALRPIRRRGATSKSTPGTASDLLAASAAAPVPASVTAGEVQSLGEHLTGTVSAAADPAHITSDTVVGDQSSPADNADSQHSQNDMGNAQGRKASTSKKDRGQEAGDQSDEPDQGQSRDQGREPGGDTGRGLDGEGDANDNSSSGGRDGEKDDNKGNDQGSRDSPDGEITEGQQLEEKAEPVARRLRREGVHTSAGTATRQPMSRSPDPMDGMGASLPGTLDTLNAQASSLGSGLDSSLAERSLQSKDIASDVQIKIQPSDLSDLSTSDVQIRTQPSDLTDLSQSSGKSGDALQDTVAALPPSKGVAGHPPVDPVEANEGQVEPPFEEGLCLDESLSDWRTVPNLKAEEEPPKPAHAHDSAPPIDFQLTATPPGSSLNGSPPAPFGGRPTRKEPPPRATYVTAAKPEDSLAYAHVLSPKKGQGQRRATARPPSPSQQHSAERVQDPDGATWRAGASQGGGARSPSHAGSLLPTSKPPRSPVSSESGAKVNEWRKGASIRGAPSIKQEPEDEGPMGVVAQHGGFSGGTDTSPPSDLPLEQSGEANAASWRKGASSGGAGLRSLPLAVSADLSSVPLSPSSSHLPSASATQEAMTDQEVFTWRHGASQGGGDPYPQSLPSAYTPLLPRTPPFQQAAHATEVQQAAGMPSSQFSPPPPTFQDDGVARSGVAEWRKGASQGGAVPLLVSYLPTPPTPLAAISEGVEELEQDSPSTAHGVGDAVRSLLSPQRPSSPRPSSPSPQCETVGSAPRPTADNTHPAEEVEVSDAEAAIRKLALDGRRYASPSPQPSPPKETVSPADFVIASEPGDDRPEGTPAQTAEAVAVAVAAAVAAITSPYRGSVPSPSSPSSLHLGDESHEGTQAQAEEASAAAAVVADITSTYSESAPSPSSPPPPSSSESEAVTYPHVSTSPTTTSLPGHWPRHVLPEGLLSSLGEDSGTSMGRTAKDLISPQPSVDKDPCPSVPPTTECEVLHGPDVAISAATWRAGVSQGGGARSTSHASPPLPTLTATVNTFAINAATSFTCVSPAERELAFSSATQPADQMLNNLSGMLPHSSTVRDSCTGQDSNIVQVGRTVQDDTTVPVGSEVLDDNTVQVGSTVQAGSTVQVGSTLRVDSTVQDSSFWLMQDVKKAASILLRVISSTDQPPAVVAAVHSAAPKLLGIATAPALAASARQTSAGAPPHQHHHLEHRTATSSAGAPLPGAPGWPPHLSSAGAPPQSAHAALHSTAGAHPPDASTSIAGLTPYGSHTTTLSGSAAQPSMAMECPTTILDTTTTLDTTTSRGTLDTVATLSMLSAVVTTIDDMEALMPGGSFSRRSTSTGSGYAIAPKPAAEVEADWMPVGSFSRRSTNAGARRAVPSLSVSTSVAGGDSSLTGKASTVGGVSNSIPVAGGDSSVTGKAITDGGVGNSNSVAGADSSLTGKAITDGGVGNINSVAVADPCPTRKASTDEGVTNRASDFRSNGGDQMGAWRGGASSGGSGPGVLCNLLDCSELLRQRPDQMAQWRGGASTAEQRPDQMGAWRGGASSGGSGPGVYMHSPGLDAASEAAEQRPDQMGAWRGGASGGGSGPGVSMHSPGLDAASTAAELRPDQMGAWRAGASVAGAVPLLIAPRTTEQAPFEMVAWRAGASVAGAVPLLIAPRTTEQAPFEMEAWRAGASVAGTVPSLPAPITVGQVADQTGLWRAGASLAGDINVETMISSEGAPAYNDHGPDPLKHAVDGLCTFDESVKDLDKLIANMKARLWVIDSAPSDDHLQPGAAADVIASLEHLASELQTENTSSIHREFTPALDTRVTDDRTATYPILLTPGCSSRKASGPHGHNEPEQQAPFSELCSDGGKEAVKQQVPMRRLSAGSILQTVNQQAPMSGMSADSLKQSVELLTWLLSHAPRDSALAQSVEDTLSEMVNSFPAEPQPEASPPAHQSARPRHLSSDTHTGYRSTGGGSSAAGGAVGEAAGHPSSDIHTGHRSTSGGRLSAGGAVGEAADPWEQLERLAARVAAESSLDPNQTRVPPHSGQVSSDPLDLAAGAAPLMRRVSTLPQAAPFSASAMKAAQADIQSVLAHLGASCGGTQGGLASFRGAPGGLASCGGAPGGFASSPEVKAAALLDRFEVVADEMRQFERDTLLQDRVAGASQAARKDFRGQRTSTTAGVVPVAKLGNCFLSQGGVDGSFSSRQLSDLTAVSRILATVASVTSAAPQASSESVRLANAVQQTLPKLLEVVQSRRPTLSIPGFSEDPLLILDRLLDELEAAAALTPPFERGDVTAELTSLLSPRSFRSSSGGGGNTQSRSRISSLGGGGTTQSLSRISSLDGGGPTHSLPRTSSLVGSAAGETSSLPAYHGPHHPTFGGGRTVQDLPTVSEQVRSASSSGAPSRVCDLEMAAAELAEVVDRMKRQHLNHDQQSNSLYAQHSFLAEVEYSTELLDMLEWLGHEMSTYGPALLEATSMPPQHRRAATTSGPGAPPSAFANDLRQAADLLLAAAQRSQAGTRLAVIVGQTVQALEQLAFHTPTLNKWRDVTRGPGLTAGSNSLELDASIFKLGQLLSTFEVHEGPGQAGLSQEGVRGVPSRHRTVSARNAPALLSSQSSEALANHMQALAGRLAPYTQQGTHSLSGGVAPPEPTDLSQLLLVVAEELASHASTNASHASTNGRHTSTNGRHGSSRRSHTHSQSSAPVTSTESVISLQEVRAAASLLGQALKVAGDDPSVLQAVQSTAGALRQVTNPGGGSHHSTTGGVDSHSLGGATHDGDFALELLNRLVDDLATLEAGSCDSLVDDRTRTPPPKRRAGTRTTAEGLAQHTLPLAVHGRSGSMGKAFAESVIQISSELQSLVEDLNAQSHQPASSNTSNTLAGGSTDGGSWVEARTALSGGLLTVASVLKRHGVSIAAAALPSVHAHRQLQTSAGSLTPAYAHHQQRAQADSDISFGGSNASGSSGSSARLNSALDPWFLEELHSAAQILSWTLSCTDESSAVAEAVYETAPVLLWATYSNAGSKGKSAVTVIVAFNVTHTFTCTFSLNGSYNKTVIVTPTVTVIVAFNVPNTFTSTFSLKGAYYITAILTPTVTVIVAVNVPNTFTITFSVYGASNATAILTPTVTVIVACYVTYTFTSTFSVNACSATSGYRSARSSPFTTYGGTSLGGAISTYHSAAASTRHSPTGSMHGAASTTSSKLVTAKDILSEVISELGGPRPDYSHGGYAPPLYTTGPVSLSSLSPSTHRPRGASCPGQRSFGANMGAAELEDLVSKMKARQSLVQSQAGAQGPQPDNSLEMEVIGRLDWVAGELRLEQQDPTTDHYDSQRVSQTRSEAGAASSPRQESELAFALRQAGIIILCMLENCQEGAPVAEAIHEVVPMLLESAATVASRSDFYSANASVAGSDVSSMLASTYPLALSRAPSGSLSAAPLESLSRAPSRSLSAAPLESLSRAPSGALSRASSFRPSLAGSAVSSTADLLHQLISDMDVVEEMVRAADMKRDPLDCNRSPRQPAASYGGGSILKSSKGPSAGHSQSPRWSSTPGGSTPDQQVVLAVSDLELLISQLRQSPATAASSLTSLLGWLYDAVKAVGYCPGGAPSEPSHLGPLVDSAKAVGNCPGGAPSEPRSEHYMQTSGSDMDIIQPRRRRTVTFSIPGDDGYGGRDSNPDTANKMLQPDPSYLWISAGGPSRAQSLYESGLSRFPSSAGDGDTTSATTSRFPSSAGDSGFYSAASIASRPASQVADQSRLPPSAGGSVGGDDYTPTADGCPAADCRRTASSTGGRSIESAGGSVVEASQAIVLSNYSSASIDRRDATSAGGASQTSVLSNFSSASIDRRDAGSGGGSVGGASQAIVLSNYSRASFDRGDANSTRGSVGGASQAIVLSNYSCASIDRRDANSIRGSFGGASETSGSSNYSSAKSIEFANRALPSVPRLDVASRSDTGTGLNSPADSQLALVPVEPPPAPAPRTNAIADIERVISDMRSLGRRISMAIQQLDTLLSQLSTLQDQITEQEALAEAAQLSSTSTTACVEPTGGRSSAVSEGMHSQRALMGPSMSLDASKQLSNLQVALASLLDDSASAGQESDEFDQEGWNRIQILLDQAHKLSTQLIDAGLQTPGSAVVTCLSTPLSLSSTPDGSTATSTPLSGRSYRDVTSIARRSFFQNEGSFPSGMFCHDIDSLPSERTSHDVDSIILSGKSFHKEGGIPEAGIPSRSYHAVAVGPSRRFDQEEGSIHESGSIRESLCAASLGTSGLGLSFDEIPDYGTAQASGASSQPDLLFNPLYDIASRSSSQVSGERSTQLATVIETGDEAESAPTRRANWADGDLPYQEDGTWTDALNTCDHQPLETVQQHSSVEAGEGVRPNVMDASREQDAMLQERYDQVLGVSRHAQAACAANDIIVTFLRIMQGRYGQPAARDRRLPSTAGDLASPLRPPQVSQAAGSSGQASLKSLATTPLGAVLEFISPVDTPEAGFRNVVAAAAKADSITNKGTILSTAGLTDVIIGRDGALYTADLIDIITSRDGALYTAGMMDAITNTTSAVSPDADTLLLDHTHAGPRADSSEGGVSTSSAEPLLQETLLLVEHVMGKMYNAMQPLAVRRPGVYSQGGAGQGAVAPAASQRLARAASEGGAALRSDLRAAGLVQELGQACTELGRNALDHRPKSTSSPSRPSIWGPNTYTVTAPMVGVLGTAANDPVALSLMLQKQAALLAAALEDLTVFHFQYDQAKHGQDHSGPTQPSTNPYMARPNKTDIAPGIQQSVDKVILRCQGLDGAVQVVQRQTSSGGGSTQALALSSGLERLVTSDPMHTENVACSSGMEAQPECDSLPAGAIAMGFDTEGHTEGRTEIDTEGHTERDTERCTEVKTEIDIEGHTERDTEGHTESETLLAEQAAGTADHAIGQLFSPALQHVLFSDSDSLSSGFPSAGQVYNGSSRRSSLSSGLPSGRLVYGRSSRRSTVESAPRSPIDRAPGSVSKVLFSENPLFGSSRRATRDLKRVSSIPGISASAVPSTPTSTGRSAAAAGSQAEEGHTSAPPPQPEKGMPMQGDGALPISPSRTRRGSKIPSILPCNIEDAPHATRARDTSISDAHYRRLSSIPTLGAPTAGMTEAVTSRAISTARMSNAGSSRAETFAGMTEAGASRAISTAGMSDAGSSRAETFAGMTEAGASRAISTAGMSNAGSSRAETFAGMTEAGASRAISTAGMSDAGSSRAETFAGMTEAGASRAISTAGMSDAGSSWAETTAGITEAGASRAMLTAGMSDAACNRAASVAEQVQNRSVGGSSVGQVSLESMELFEGMKSQRLNFCM
eukprot:gene24198-9796_t